jgi:hypothetical protein
VDSEAHAGTIAPRQRSKGSRRKATDMAAHEIDRLFTLNSTLPTAQQASAACATALSRLLRQCRRKSGMLKACASKNADMQKNPLPIQLIHRRFDAHLFDMN